MREGIDGSRDRCNTTRVLGSEECESEFKKEKTVCEVNVTQKTPRKKRLPEILAWKVQWKIHSIESAVATERILAWKTHRRENAAVTLHVLATACAQ